jgi:hypothetical protein
MAPLAVPPIRHDRKDQHGEHAVPVVTRHMSDAVLCGDVVWCWVMLCSAVMLCEAM